MKYNIGFIGFGVVGQGLAEILYDKREYLKRNYNFEYSIVAVSDISKGSIFNPEGLEIPILLDMVKQNSNLGNYPEGEPGWDSIRTIRESNSHIIVEVTYTDIRTAEPAFTHFKAALNSKKHLVTTNKGPVALHYHELGELADANGVKFKFEGTVMSGTPLINLALRNLAGCRIERIRGILNGTTNFILTEMEKGIDYKDALKKAQDLGYAEAVPDADVKGWDTMVKIVILSNVVMGEPVKPSEVPCKGIELISMAQVKSALRENSRWKLIGSVELKDGTVRAEVSPEKLPLSHPLSRISGPINAVTFSTDLLGDVTV
ncbi:MAG: homoserine dehydrogenase, partial [Fidelibacterota bacterium]